MIPALKRLTFILATLAFLFAQASVPVMAMPANGAAMAPHANMGHPCPDTHMPMNDGAGLPCSSFACAASPVVALLPDVIVLRVAPVASRFVPWTPIVHAGGTPAPDPLPPKTPALI